tara:strand:+ start:4872 stop:5552 length:681 start_codon:yes stop_codon:yes gene_type:complete
MKVKNISPFVSIKKVRVKLPRRVVRDLKEISKLSSNKQWEYAGNIKYMGGGIFSKPSKVTSESRSCVHTDEITRVWYSEISYHTHPGIGYNEDVTCQSTPIFTTLPSNADFEAYIKGFPEMQVNIICDSHGYYVIDILHSTYNLALPLPISINAYMRNLRSTPFMRICAFSDDGLEYFHTTMKNWKREINENVNKDLMKLYGVSIMYYTYDEDPPEITMYQGIDVA